MNPRFAVWLVNGLLAALAAFSLFPLLWMLSASFMPAGAASSLPTPILPPSLTLENYRILFGSIGMGRYLLNSVLIATVATAISVTFNLMAGYAFAKLRFRGRDAIFRLLLGALVIPGQVAMLPLFLMLKPLGLIDSYGGAIVPAMASVFGIFLVRQFARGIPDELLEAARIDGAGELRIFTTVVVPLLKPIVATLAVFSFLGTWNDFMWPLIVLTDDSLHTLPVALAGLSREHVQDNELMMAGSVVTVLPVLLLFLALQRQYMEGLLAGSVKGMKAALLALVLALASNAWADDLLLDDFADPALWTLSASDDVKAALRPSQGPHGSALCIDFDFGKVTGYVSARRAVPIDFPARFAFSLGVRGDAPLNALQFKLVDASGDNVWWANRPEYKFPHEWQTQRFRQKDIAFAWGPTGDRVLRRSASAEIVIASGSGAGKGSACFDRLVLRRLPDTPSPDEPHEFGEVNVRWLAGTGPSRYDLQFSDDGASWRTVRHVEGARGDVQHHFFADAQARAVRVVADAPSPAIALGEAANANAFFAGIARQAPRGFYPRAYIGEQSYWTVFGVDGGGVASLMSEDGAIEPVPGVGALEPFLVVDGRVATWADARIGHSLRDGELPMPTTRWRVGDLVLDIAAFGDGQPDDARAVVRYTVRNEGRRTRALALALAWRPFQVNPPTQFLAHPGGAVAIDSMKWEEGALWVDGALRLRPMQAPSSVRVEPAAAGPVVDWLADAAPARRAAAVRDPDGFANGVLRYDMQLRPGAQRTIDVVLPIEAVAMPSRIDAARAQARAAAHWHAALDTVGIDGPGEVAEIARTMRSSLGQILVNRSGPAVQPGARAYARSWIRDGALTSSALLRLGHDDVARDFLLWFAPFQFRNGKVPCCATARGADPVPENDSDGEFAFAAAELWRYTGDEKTARALWPHVAAAVAHMETLRASERVEANRAGERAAYFGLMPPSISHEGYSDKPAYSYWDDFWAFTGYRSAVELAAGLGLASDASRIAAQRDEFLADLQASLAASTARFGLDVLPGAADRGDFDPTSSTIALSPGGLLHALPRPLVQRTFDGYWRDFQARRSDEAAGIRHGDGAYTPYEWRNVGAFVRLGERDRAQEALAYFYADRRPAGWNQWAEVVARDAREPRFLGDMPHGWVASDHIRSVLDLFAYEDEGERSLVLAAGVPMAWLRGKGLSIRELRTPYGRLTWAARIDADGAIDVRVSALGSFPPGGVTLRGPWGKSRRVALDGQSTDMPADAIALTHLPAHIRIAPE